MIKMAIAAMIATLIFNARLDIVAGRSIFTA
jgi:hypothetical protein